MIKWQKEVDSPGGMGGFGGMNINSLMKEAKKCKRVWKNRKKN